MSERIGVASGGRPCARGPLRPEHAARLVVDQRTQQIFEIYIPEAAYHHPAAQCLLSELGAMTKGATVYQAVEGSWENTTEAVRVVRLAITTVDSEGVRLCESEDMRGRMRDLIVEFMERLEASQTHLEESVFFNDWTVNGTFVTRRSQPS